MSSEIGKYLTVSLFGESHGEAVGVTIQGLPSGKKVDTQLVERYLYRRSTGRNAGMSARKEPDKVRILSGMYNGLTTGTPLCMMIENADMHSKDYKEMESLARPSHADYTGYVRYKGYNDIRGGGHFSGRLTTPMVMAGAVCMGILKDIGIDICAVITDLGDVETSRFTDKDINLETFERVKGYDIPALTAREELQAHILQTRERLDSVGGHIQCVISGLRAGVGSPIFGGLENRLASALFGIPALKGIEFGDDQCPLYGSVYNDALRIDQGRVVSLSNHDGGINGGISNGMPILYTLRFKATPSIAAVQDTVDYKNLSDSQLSIKGRHDPCLLVRAVPVVECVSAIAILDAVMEAKIYE